MILIIVSTCVYGLCKLLRCDNNKLSVQDKKFSTQRRKRTELLKYSDTDVSNALDELKKGIAEVAKLEEQFNVLKSVVEKTVSDGVLHDTHDLARLGSKVRSESK
ncbi:MAG: hypothetical protein ACTJLM_01585 [Ehrlichia sp.]